MELPISDVFVSYSHKNKRFVERLANDLRNHQIVPWLDTVDLAVGDPLHSKIEQAIEHSEFFCFVLTRASLDSFYARRIELQSAIGKMVEQKRQDFILPIMRERVTLPPFLRTLKYLDFTTVSKYKANLHKLINKINKTEEKFTGTRIYKNVDTSLVGRLVGAGHPMKQITTRGFCVMVHFHDGRIKTMQTFTDGKPDGAKAVLYDPQGRVSEIILFKDNSVVDSWVYIYDESTGRRCKKVVVEPGSQPSIEYLYDSDGRRVAENVLVKRGDR